MTDDLFVAGLLADVRELARLVAQLADLQGYDDTAVQARRVADKTLESYNELKECME